MGLNWNYINCVRICVERHGDVKTRKLVFGPCELPEGALEKAFLLLHLDLSSSQTS